MIISCGTLAVEQIPQWLYFYKNDEKTFIRVFSPILQITQNRLLLNNTKVFVEFTQHKDGSEGSNSVKLLCNGEDNLSMAVKLTENEIDTVVKMIDFNLDCYKYLHE